MTNTAPWSNGNDAWSTPRKRWFDSIRGYLLAQVRQSEERLGLNPGGCGFDSGPGHGLVGKLADHLGLEPGMLWVRVPPGLMETDRPRGAAWSARLPVTQDDHEDVVPGVQIPSRALWTDRARYANRQSGQAQPLVICGFDSRLRHCEQHASAGHRRAQLPVKQPARKAMQVQLLPGALLIRPVRLSAQDAGPSSRKGGFDSRTGY